MGLETVGEAEELVDYSYASSIVVSLHEELDEPDQVTLEQPPVHPVKAFQRAFEESIVESLEGPESAATKPAGPQDAEARRRLMLANDDYPATYNARWRSRPGAKHHPLWKLLAQISFGVHLLHQRLAKSDEEVIKILQNHLMEINSFFRYTLDDFDLALKDVSERISYLRLPLEHVNIFDTMLDDRNFRNSIIEGNEKIEQVLHRTSRYLNDALIDTRNGKEASIQALEFFNSLGRDWTVGNRRLGSVFGNIFACAEQWLKLFDECERKGNNLDRSLTDLRGILNEMIKRAGAASRRSLLSSRMDSDQRSGRSSRSSSRAPSPLPAQFSRAKLYNKPLPRDPPSAQPSSKSTPNPRHPIPFEQRFENPRKQPTPPVQSSPRTDVKLASPEASNREPAAHIHNASVDSTQSSPPPNQFQKSPQPDDTPQRSPSPVKEERQDSIMVASPQSLLDRRMSERVQTNTESNSPVAPDSAYSTGSSGYDKPSSPESLTALPQPRRKPANLVLFPNSSPYGTSSPMSTQSNLALPLRSQRPSPSPQGLGIAEVQREMQHSSTDPLVRKKSSLASIKRVFHRFQPSKGSNRTRSLLSPTKEFA